MQRYWFKQKRYGFGAAPASWQGWAVTIAYVAIVAALGSWAFENEAEIVSRATKFTIITLALTVVLVGIAWRTTEGGFRWRWGDKD
jgi:hypothetical protein